MKNKPKSVEEIVAEITTREDFDCSEAHDALCLVSDSIVQEVIQTLLTQNTERVRKERDAEIEEEREAEIEAVLEMLDNMNQNNEFKVWTSYRDLHYAISALTTPDHE